MLNPATLALIVQGIQLAIQAAPTVISVSEHAYGLIKSLFEAGAISAEQQNAVRAHVDAIMEASLAGNEPPAWTVEPDPV